MWLEWITWEPVNFANTGQWPWNVRPGRETASPLGTVGFPVLTGRGSWWAAVHGVTEELDMTQQLNNGQQMGVKEQE